MNKLEFLAVIEIIKSGRGPKPKDDTVSQALGYYFNQGKADRYARRLVARVEEVLETINGHDGSRNATLEAYAKLNGMENSNARHAVWMVYNKDYTPSKAAMEAGSYSARVYTLHASVERLHGLIEEWRAQHGRNDTTE